ncbi:3-oxoacyl-[acyl-carrier-protein] FabG [Cyphellophora attinorum]|uniref:3-oxoacyl-[acyl-carrier-protein] FabG n=1 Tax=Cyphellophora attinorum TaxID=1664694 RepID=A0A0N1HCS5_9EURO|nr:3-oxoacyl-[acyl-carrier-protein] FabG [Phialophora attinorum]KPI42237.1 3-oxoacyl-[acyl-carrier-protein] FabG [Phialophora attinorum]
MDISGVALITGAASGIGAATAIALARDGCSGLALADINEESISKVMSQVQALGLPKQPRIHSYVLDVTDEKAVDRIVAEVAQAFGRIDYLVNAAGIAKKVPGGAAFTSTPDWQRVIDVNLTGSFFVLRAAAQVMLKQSPLLSTIDGRELQRGSIVNFASILGAVGVPMTTAYTASKHGVLGLTKTASEDYAAKGLRINAICPGYTETPMTMGNELVRDVMAEKVQKDVPMRRMGKPQEIADGVVYLCGGRSSFVTGTGLFVDGGYTQR